MQRSMMKMTAILAAALWLSACGGSTAHSASPPPTTAPTVTAPTTAPTGSPATPAATTTSAPATATIAATACSLVTTAQVQSLLGLAPSGAGTEQDYQPNYKTCRWLTTPPAGGNVNGLRLAVVITSPTSQGFGTPTQVGNPTPLPGVGESATLYSTPAGASFAEKLLLATKGHVQVSIDLNYGGTPGPPADLPASLSAATNAVSGSVAQ